MKKKMIIGLLVVALVLTVAVAASATTGAKQIGVTYRNIMLMVNGNVVAAQPGYGEPFIVDSEGRTYIPIRMAAEALGLDVEWVDWLNAVKITGSASTDELEALRAENERLREQLEDCQNDYEEEEDTDLGDLEDDLNDDYDELEDVAIEDISLDGDEDDVDVEIEVDLDDYGDEWEDLDDSDIEDWIEDLVGDIQDELSDDTYVSGKIIDIDSDDVLVKFYKNGDSSQRVTFYDEDYRGGSSSDGDDVADDLEGSSYDVGGIDFRMSSVTYDEDDDSVAVNLFAEDSNAADDWDDLSGSTIENDVIDICEDIVDAFDEEDIDIETIDISFYDEDELYIDSYDYDVDDGDLD